MARFTYKAKDAKGITQKGIVEALTDKQAILLLHEKGYFVISVKLASSSFSFFSHGLNISFEELILFTRQLATMITAGLTLTESLSILQQQLNKPALLKLVNQIEDEVQGGKSLAQVLEKYPKIFPPIYIALVKAGEASGKLDIILTRLADNLEKSRDFKSKVKGTMIYPTIVISGMGIVTFIVMTVVVPRLTTMYKEFGVSLPLPTQILIAMSNILVNSWYLIIGGLVIFGMIFLKWKETWFGKHLLASFALNVPIFGSLVRQSTLVEVTRTLSMLIEGGVPILVALDISQNATSNILYKEVFASTASKVEKGFSLSEPLSNNPLFPPILGQMVAVGEQTGKLGDSLGKLSKYFETEAENAIHSLTTMMEPLIMIILGLGVGFLVMAVLLPIYSLTSKF